MRRSSRLSRVATFGAVSAFISLSACSIFSGSDDSNGAASEDDGGSDAHDSGKRDSGSTRRDSGTDGGGSTDDGGISLPHDDAGHVLLPDGGTLTCDPQSLGSFSGGTYAPPKGPFANVCTQTDFTNYAACVTASDTTQCAQFLSGGSRVTCGACLLTPESASRHGATVGADPASSLLNVPGCLAIAFNEGTSTSGCGAAAQHAGNCVDLACDTTFNCAGATQDELNACATTAANGECGSYEDTAQAACNKDAGGADSVCNVTDVASFTTFMNVFCGTGG